jgi:hypothetical protein
MCKNVDHCDSFAKMFLMMPVIQGKCASDVLNRHMCHFPYSSSHLLVYTIIPDGAEE